MRRDLELPRSYEAERGVLGAVLMDNSVLSSVLQFVGPDDFAWDTRCCAISVRASFEERHTERKGGAIT
jgi:hypothetical protein